MRRPPAPARAQHLINAPGGGPADLDRTRAARRATFGLHRDRIAPAAGETGTSLVIIKSRPSTSGHTAAEVQDIVNDGNKMHAAAKPPSRCWS